MFRIAGAFWTLLLVQPAAVLAEDLAGPVLEGGTDPACVPATCALFDVDDRVLAVLPYPQRYQPSHPSSQSAQEWSGRDESPQSYDSQRITENEHWIVTFSGLESLSLKTLWEDNSSRVYLGVDKTGFAGIMFGRKETSADDNLPGEYSSNGLRLTGPGARPLLHSQSLNYEHPDLSKASGQDKN